MTPFRIALLVAAVSVVSISGGYWLGFRHAFELGFMADAPVRGTLAISQMRMLETNHVEDLRTTWESDVDLGLLWWAHVERYRLNGVINVLSGQDVIPMRETYVRRLAQYRKEHGSPLRTSEVVSKMLADVRAKDPGFAMELEAGGREAGADIDAMIMKYGQ
jgi:hypothetical protein